MVPAQTPEPVLETLRAALRRALAEPTLRARLTALDMVPLAETGQPAIDRLEASSARYGKIAHATGMKVN